MGSTVVVALISVDSLYLAYVGDSRAYLIRGEEIQKLTKDHSLVADLVSQRKITADQARTHPLRHVITRAIGTSPKVQVDSMWLKIQRRDKVILCTDGLTDLLDDKQILDIVLEGENPQRTCQKLVQEANKLGGFDNATIVLIHN